MTFACEVTVQDIVAFHLDVWRRAPRQKKMLAYAASSIVIFIMLSAMLWPFIGSASMLVGLPIGLVGLMGGGVLRRGQIIRATRKFYRTNPDPSLICRHTFELDKTGITEQVPNHTSHYSWQLVQEVVDTGRHLFVYVGQYKAFVFPINATLENATREQILECFKSENIQIIQVRPTYDGA